MNPVEDHCLHSADQVPFLAGKIFSLHDFGKYYFCSYFELKNQFKNILS
jgi:hypothetical protein